MLEIFKISPKSRDFWIFFRFHVEARYSAIFHRTIQKKCMSGISSGFPITQSVRNFYKKTKKSRWKSENQRRLVRFSIFVGGAVSYSHPLKIFIHFVLRSFIRLQKQEFFKNSHYLLRYENFLETYQHILSPCRFGKTFSNSFSFFF